MSALHVEPWIPPFEPDLARLAMDVADRLDVAELRAWPEHRKGGIGFGALPPFLSWRGTDAEGRLHLVLLQPREAGALVPGARIQPLPAHWLEELDLESLARPLAHHPAFPGEASVHVVQLPAAGEARVRDFGVPAPDMVREVLARVSSVQVWSFAD